MKNSTSKTRRFFLLVAGLLAVMSACKKENAPSELRAVMNDFANSGQKAYIDPKQYSCFVINEKMRLNNSTATVTALERDDRQCVIGDAPEDTAYKAFYPAKFLANPTVDLTGGLNVAVNFPREQECIRDNDGNQIIDNPMIAQLSGYNANNNTLHFNNVCALLKITVRTLDAFDSIRITMSGQKLWGSGEISGNKVVMNGTATTGRETVVLKLPAGHHGSPAGEAFYIMIPEVTLSGCTVTVNIMNGNNAVKSFSRTGVNATLAYNCIHTLGNFTFNAPVFSVAPDKTVVFAPGNLQFQAAGCIQETQEDLIGGTWRFAEHQWDYIGNNPGNSVTNRNTRMTQSDWIDLFCWGTSGWNSSADYYTPFRVGQSSTSYNPGTSLSNSLTGQYARADWGIFNNIYNPSTKVIDPAGTWYTMTKDEWVYMLDTRSGIRFAMAKVGNVNGMLIFPDGWDASWYDPQNANNYTATYNSNSMTVADFQQLENRGVVFLPAAGNQTTKINEVGEGGSYWSSTYSDKVAYDRNGNRLAYAYGLYFTTKKNPDNPGAAGPHERSHGRCVRLVRPVQ